MTAFPRPAPPTTSMARAVIPVDADGTVLQRADEVVGRVHPHSDLEWISAAAEVVRNARLTTLLLRRAFGVPQEAGVYAGVSEGQRHSTGWTCGRSWLKSAAGHSWAARRTSSPTWP